MTQKRWELLVKVGEKTHRQVVKAETLLLATWALRNMLDELEDTPGFYDGPSLETSVRPVAP